MVNKPFNAKIKEIHESSLFGSIIETGAGACISNTLMSVDGASKTIYDCFQPYAKETQHFGSEELFLGNIRSVSKEFCEIVINHKRKELEYSKHDHFILVSSFQLQPEDDIENKKITHGWIGLQLRKNGLIEYYHLTIQERKPRTEYFRIISEFCIELLYAEAFKKLFSSIYLDNYIRSDILEPSNELRKDILLNLTEIRNKELYQDKDNFLLFTKNGSVGRLEEKIRDVKGLIIQKGSFNPIHEGHLEVMELSKKQFPEYYSCFMISRNIFDKDSLHHYQIIERIKKINSLGYDVIVCDKPLFKDNILYLSTRYNKKQIIFPVGLDTINRFCKSTSKEIGSKLPYLYNFKFLVFKRDGLEMVEETKSFLNSIIINTESTNFSGFSSTKIRNKELNSKI